MDIIDYFAEDKNLCKKNIHLTIVSWTTKFYLYKEQHLILFWTLNFLLVQFLWINIFY